MSNELTWIAIAVVEHEGQFLVGLRPDGIPLAGFSEFPGGKVEPHESAEAAAVRECLEETGLEVTIVEAFPEHQHQYAHGQMRLSFFRCRLNRFDMLPRAPFHWVDRKDLRSLRFPAGNDGLLEILVAK